MAKTIMECWDMMSADNASPRTLPPQMYHYVMGNSAPGGSVVSHAFGQFVIDAWQAKNSKILNDGISESSNTSSVPKEPDTASSQSSQQNRQS